jgi:iron complex outermembrane receptor protein
LRLFAVSLVCGSLALPVFGEGPGSEKRDLTGLSLEELSNVEVTSVSKREEPLADAPAAVAVITNEDLRRYGATTIPEALRLVPGLHVGQVGASQWEVSARGFSSVQSANLLVLNDTRSIYTPLFAGVFWDVQDVLMEDVQRIEVIRGPGASLWGANAVDGVINVTTRSAKDTQGTYVEGEGGSQQRASAAMRYGGKLADGLYFRVFAKGRDDTGEYNGSQPANDNWKLGHMGFRADWQTGAKDLLTFQGDAYSGDIGQVIPAVTIIGRPGPDGRLIAQVAGGNLLTRWTHDFAPGAQLQVRAYYDGTHRDDPTFLDTQDTFDLDVQQGVRLPFRQDLLLGFNYRTTDDRIQGKGLFALTPPDSQDTVVSGFIQDQISVLPNLKITLGTKLEHNDFSGFEYQPTARFAWNPTQDQTFWGAVSRAVRVPTRLERDVDINVTDPAQDPVLKLLGTKTFGAEHLVAYELGYRLRLAKAILVDLAAYYDVHRRLASLELGTAFADPRTGQGVVPLVEQNLTHGVGKGVEASLTVTPLRGWRVVGNYTYFLLQLTAEGMDLNHELLFTGSTPRNQFSVQSYLDLPAHLQLDLFFRYVSRLPSSEQLSAGQVTDAYATADARLAYRGFEKFEISLAGRSLLQDHHREFPGGDEVKRAFLAKVAGRF